MKPSHILLAAYAVLLYELAGSSCLAVGLMYNYQQEQYCLIPSPGLPWPQGVSVVIGCRFNRLRPTGHSAFSVFHNDVELTQNSSKHTINRPPANVEKKTLRVQVNVLNFTESDTGNYTCSADFFRKPTIQNTTAVYINSSSTPCAPKWQSSSGSSSKNKPTISIVVYLSPISPNTVKTEVPTSSEIVPSSSASSVPSPVQTQSVSSVPSPVQRESVSSVPSPVQTQSVSSVQSPVQMQSVSSVPNPVQRESVSSVPSMVQTEILPSASEPTPQPHTTMEATTTCVLVVEENVTRVHTNTFIAISVVVILVMVVGTAIISVTVICTRRTSKAEKERRGINDCVIYQIPDTSEIHFQPRPSDNHVDI